MIRKNTKIIAISGAVLFLGALGAFVFFFSMVEQHKADFASQTTARLELEAHRAAVSSLKRTLEETQIERTSLFSRFLKEEGVVDFLALVESLGKEQGVVLTTDSLTVESIDTTFETLVLGVVVEGSYAGVTQVLKILELLPYQTKITGVSLIKVEGETWRSTYQVRVTKFKKQ